MKVKENEILWAKTNKNAIIPTKEKENAGYDIYACFNDDFIIIKPHGTLMVSTGIACALNDMYYLQLEERGSTGSKGIKRSAGVVDSGYRGEIFVALTNTNDVPIIISKIIDRVQLNKFLKNIGLSGIGDTYILYPYTKAICQGIVHKVPNLESKEITYTELCEYTSNRGKQKLGESGK